MHSYIRQQILVLLIQHSVMNAIIGTTINDR